MTESIRLLSAAVKQKEQFTDADQRFWDQHGYPGLVLPTERGADLEYEGQPFGVGDIGRNLIEAAAKRGGLAVSYGTVHREVWGRGTLNE